MAGFLDLLSPALTVGTSAATAQIQGTEAKNERDQADVLKMLATIRQQHLDANKQSLDDATMRHLNTQSDVLKTPVVKAPPETMNPGQGLRQPDGSYKVEVAARPQAPLMGSPEWKDAERFKAGLTPRPDQPLERVETAEGPRLVTRSAAIGQRPAMAGDGKGPSATAQGVQARLLGAVSEARAAIPRMEAMEKKWLDHPETIPGMAGGALAKMATRFSGEKSIHGIAAETAGEQFGDPEVVQYMRDAALMARATQLMSSRGGSEAMVNSEQLLNRAVPRSEGLRQSVSAAQKSRNAIFGPVGGLMQALTPEQISKVEAGLKALDAGDKNGAMIVGSVFDEARAATQGGGRGGNTPPPKVTPQRRSTDAAPKRPAGATDEDWAAYLKDRGYTP